MYKHPEVTTVLIGWINSYNEDDFRTGYRGTVGFNWTSEEISHIVPFRDSDVLPRSNMLKSLKNGHWKEVGVAFTYVDYPGTNIPGKIKNICLAKEVPPDELLKKLDPKQKKIPHIQYALKKYILKDDNYVFD